MINTVLEIEVMLCRILDVWLNAFRKYSGMKWAIIIISSLSVDYNSFGGSAARFSCVRQSILPKRGLCAMVFP